MRSLILAAIAVLAFSPIAGATFGSATGGAGAGRAIEDKTSPPLTSTHTYQYDARRRCRDDHGRLVASRMCPAPKPQPHCSRAQLCGDRCLPRDQVCHKARDPHSGLPTGKRMHSVRDPT